MYAALSRVIPPCCWTPECAAGWGIVYDPVTNSTNNDDGIFTCINCTLTTQVPLTEYSGVKAAYVNGVWAIVPKSQRTARPPRGSRSTFYKGQCVTCPAGYAPDASSTQCGEPCSAAAANTAGAPGPFLVIRHDVACQLYAADTVSVTDTHWAVAIGLHLASINDHHNVVCPANAWC